MEVRERGGRGGVMERRGRKGNDEDAGIEPVCINK